MIARTEEFVCATDEVWRLQRKSDPECRFFQTKVAGKPGLLRGSHQGIYVFAPSGRLLARKNSLNAEKVVALLDKALEEWKLGPEDDRQPAPPSEYRPRHRWEHSYPQSGLVLFASLRDLPVDKTEATSRPKGARNRGRFNRDHVWFHAAEARAWLPAKLEVGAESRLPEPLAQRLARFHLVDNVRGQVAPFAPEEIELADFTTRVTEVTANRVKVEITGRTKAESDGVWKMGDNDWKKFPNKPRAIETQVIGRAEFERDKQRFISFELAAVGDSRGGAGLNGRRGDEARGKVGYYFTLAPDVPRHRIAPAFVDIYDAKWIRPPTE